MTNDNGKKPTIPDDDLSRGLTLITPETDHNLTHIGLVGDTYTITVTGADTNGRFCVIDMLVHPGGGPAPHRHDFEEMFVLLEGELVANFRGVETVLKTGEAINIPANAPHQFRNSSSEPARMLCICAPSGQDEFFKQIGTPVATRSTPPPPLTPDEQKAFMSKMIELAPKYKTEVLDHV